MWQMTYGFTFDSCRRGPCRATTGPVGKAQWGSRPDPRSEFACPPDRSPSRCEMSKISGHCNLASGIWCIYTFGTVGVPRTSVVRDCRLNPGELSLMHRRDAVAALLGGVVSSLVSERRPGPDFGSIERQVAGRLGVTVLDTATG